MFEHVDYYTGDPILGLVEKFNQDTRKEKVNLGIGVYCDENGRVPLLKAVEKAIKSNLDNSRSRSYLPMEGFSTYRVQVQKLLFGVDNPILSENRIATIQTLGGSGALRIGAEFLHKYFPRSKVFVSNPTWDNHIAIFKTAGFEVDKYPYYDNQTGEIAFDEMLAFLKTLPTQSIILLHPCCHNPTGVDLNKIQCDELINVLKENSLIPFIDIAYQGFAENFDEDTYLIRACAKSNLSFFVSNSFSKNLSFYSERLGALSVVCPNEKEMQLVLGQLKYTVRCNYSSPPSHGAFLAADILESDELFKMWQDEVAEMRKRIRKLRQELCDKLSARISNCDFNYFVKQCGLFSYTGFSSEQVQRLREEFAIYLVGSGRMCIAGLNANNIDYVAEAFCNVAIPS